MVRDRVDHGEPPPTQERLARTPGIRRTAFRVRLIFRRRGGFNGPGRGPALLATSRGKRATGVPTAYWLAQTILYIQVISDNSNV